VINNLTIKKMVSINILHFLKIMIKMM